MILIIYILEVLNCRTISHTKESMPSSVLNVGNVFLEKAKSCGSTVDPLKLQKLVFMAHGWKLAFTGEPLINEAFEAWRYGPVVPELYREFKEFKDGPIRRPSRTPSEQLSRNARDVIDQVWKMYRESSALELSRLTHEPGSAWSQTYESSIWGSRPIPNALIREEFLKRKRLAGVSLC